MPASPSRRIAPRPSRGALHWALRCAALCALLACAPRAGAEVVVIVSAKSAINTLNREQVRDIYLGEEREFPGGGVPLLTVLNGGAAREDFFAKVLGMSPARARGIWARLIFTGKGTAPKEVGADEIKRLIADNPNAIGIIERDALDASVKVVLRP
ncbi:MAG: phosphate ABC transporter substrate-binding protein [Pseudomonadota bacterium]